MRGTLDSATVIQRQTATIDLPTILWRRSNFNFNDSEPSRTVPAAHTILKVLAPPAAATEVFTPAHMCVGLTYPPAPSGLRRPCRTDSNCQFQSHPETDNRRTEDEIRVILVWSSRVVPGRQAQGESSGCHWRKKNGLRLVTIKSKRARLQRTTGIMRSCQLRAEAGWRIVRGLPLVLSVTVNSLAVVSMTRRTRCQL